MNEDMKMRLLASKENAEREIRKVDQEETLTIDTVYTHLKPYIMYKFLLMEEDMTTEDFTELVKISIAKTSKLDPALLKEIQRAQKCSSASSVAIKKVLLYMDIQRQLDIRFDPEKTGDIETIRDIAALIMDKRGQKQ